MVTGERMVVWCGDGEGGAEMVCGASWAGSRWTLLLDLVRLIHGSVVGR